ncbi:hypothetical protein [Megamonas funiformis]|uniref:hypothetical protein n=1 Tax=Megamonas funiformis TaxID=437897 RepID=UPI003A8CDF5B
MNLRLVKGNTEYTMTADDYSLLCDIFFGFKATKDIFESLLKDDKTKTDDLIRKKSFCIVLNELTKNIEELRFIVGKKIAPCNKTRSVQNLKANKF